MSNIDTTKFLDLDAVGANDEVRIKWKGQLHVLRPITVDQFVKNAKRINKAGAASSFEEEFEMVLEMVCEAFPTIKPEELREMELIKLNAILDFARQYNGEDNVKKEQEAAQNPPTAGK